MQSLMTTIAITILFSLESAAAAAGQKSDRLAAMDIFNFEYVADPQISPDGSTIVYVRRFGDIMSDRRYSNLWTIDFDGSNHRPLTSGHQNDSSPRWSADGKRLIYTSTKDGSPQIYLRWLDTGQTAKLTNLQFPPSGLSWSPDGEMIAFRCFVPSEPRTIAKMPPAPPKSEWAKPPAIIDKLVYRFDKRGYIKNGYVHLFVMPAEPGTPRQLSEGDYHFGGAGFRSSAAVWSPDSKSLIFSANLRDDYEYDPLNSEVYEISVADGTLKTLTERQGPDNAPAVSPDGKLIAYLGFDDRYQGHQSTQLYVMNRDGSESRSLSAKLDRDVSSPRWSSDNKGVYFQFSDRDNTKLAYYSLEGSMRVFAESLGGSGSAYGGGSYSIAPNGNFTATYTRPDLPGDVAVGTANSGSLRAVTSVNRDLLSHKKLGEVEEIWYESSKDGRKIHGWIIKPPDFDPSRKYPMILEIHGGPFANYGPRFDVEKQIWAAHDFVILYTNPRGSTSYGEEFGNLIHHSYPGDDFFDLDSGVDALIAKGYVDPDNVFVTGGSGGGVLTCWLIGRTDRFRAAASAYPVINWYSFTVTADISMFVSKYWFPGPPWEHPEHYMARSPLSLVGNVKTPTMVITGEDDYRTPMSESEQYYQALKLRKIDTVLVRVPGESHGIRQRPSHHVAKVLNIMHWFEQHKTSAADAG